MPPEPQSVPHSTITASRISECRNTEHPQPGLYDMSSQKANSQKSHLSKNKLNTNKTLPQELKYSRTVI